MGVACCNTVYSKTKVHRSALRLLLRLLLSGLLRQLHIFGSLRKDDIDDCCILLPEENVLKQQVISLFAKVLGSEYLLRKVFGVELFLFGIGQFCDFALGETEVDEGWLLLDALLRDLYRILLGLLVQLCCCLNLIFLRFHRFFLRRRRRAFLFHQNPKHFLLVLFDLLRIVHEPFLLQAFPVL